MASLRQRIVRVNDYLLRAIVTIAGLRTENDKLEQRALEAEATVEDLRLKLVKILNKKKESTASEDSPFEASELLSRKPIAELVELLSDLLEHLSNQVVEQETELKGIEGAVESTEHLTSRLDRLIGPPTNLGPRLSN